MKKPKRTYITAGQSKSNRILYFVHRYEDNANKMSADGPYDSEEQAIELMNQLLVKNICAWIVSYRG